MNNLVSAIANDATKNSDELVRRRYNFIQIFWVFVGIAFFISGLIAGYCLWKGGNLAWSTRFGVWVQVACRFR